MRISAGTPFPACGFSCTNLWAVASGGMPDRSDTPETYDYIIVGAGSAGCVLANRLTEDGKTTVLLLEGGGSDRSIFVAMPSALSIPMNTKRFNWFFESEPEPGLDGRRLHCPRGKGLGGSSSINGMVYVRGHARDYDEWVEHGAAGWGYADVLPYFKRAENWEGGADAYRGGDGPLKTSNGNRMQNPLYKAFIEAGVQAGYGATEDYNGRRQEGFGPMHMTARDGLRWSTARGYLRPVQGRPNLRVVKHALADHVIIENARATGVAYSTRGVSRAAQARREVILSAGSVGSPTILQRSGIGPAAALKRHGISVVADRPGVGSNLQDHLEVYFQFRCTQPLSLNRHLTLWGKGLIGARWLLFRSGLGATNHFESCAFIRSRAGLEWPDIQYHFLPGAMRYDGNAAFDGDGFQVHVGPNKPKSRGRIDIADSDPATKPRILFNYLQEQEDIEDWRRVIRLTREIIHQPAMDPYRGDEIQPGANVNSDAEIDAWVRANVESAYHPSCTCRMGDPGDPDTVLRPDLTVIGVDGLRVADSSIFPTIPNGNLNAPTIMAAEKAADLILGRPAPAAENAEVWIAPDWRTTQRESQAV